MKSSTLATTLIFGSSSHAHEQPGTKRVVLIRSGDDHALQRVASISVVAA